MNKNNNLIEAIKSGNLDVIAKIIENENINIDQPLDKIRNTFMHLAVSCTKKCSETLKFAIERGANIEAINSKGNTPLLWAAQKNNVEAAATLLSYGANQFARNKNGMLYTDLAKSMLHADFAKNLMEFQQKMVFETQFATSSVASPANLSSDIATSQRECSTSFSTSSDPLSATQTPSILSINSFEKQLNMLKDQHFKLRASFINSENEHSYSSNLITDSINRLDLDHSYLKQFVQERLGPINENQYTSLPKTVLGLIDSQELSISKIKEANFAQLSRATLDLSQLSKLNHRQMNNQLLEDFIRLELFNRISKKIWEISNFAFSDEALYEKTKHCEDSIKWWKNHNESQSRAQKYLIKEIHEINSQSTQIFKNKQSKLLCVCRKDVIFAVLSECAHVCCKLCAQKPHCPACRTAITQPAVPLIMP